MQCSSLSKWNQSAVQVEPHTAHGRLSAVCYLLSAFCCLLSSICCLLSSICCLLSGIAAVFFLMSAICCLLSDLVAVFFHCLLSDIADVYLSHVCLSDLAAGFTRGSVQSQQRM